MRAHLTPVKKWALATLTVALVLGLVAWGHVLAGAALTNVGMVTLSRALQAEGRPSPEALQQAERWFARALTWDPRNPSPHRGLGWVWGARGDLTKASREWLLGGFSPREFEDCAREMDRAGQSEQARVWRQRALGMRRN
jgi:hypothetical protein